MYKITFENWNSIIYGSSFVPHENETPFPKNSFALTFDDGFENNMSIAAPILTDYKVPATIYVTTNFIENNEMSWIDKIESAFKMLIFSKKILLDG